jgi:phytoene dehydrogenase-like protein
MLARDGQKVLVLEKTNWAGGMAATKELFKGYKHSVGAWAMIVLHQEMIDLLDVEKFGFETIVPDAMRALFDFFQYMHIFGKVADKERLKAPSSAPSPASFN